MDRVQLELTTRAFASRTKDSMLVASKVDRRFTEDEQFPNLWRPINRGADGKSHIGEPAPYEAAASYVKLTRLAEPAGALLVEYHLVFVEPKAWFGGANLLRSKLPMLFQSRARLFRRKLQKASQ